MATTKSDTTLNDAEKAVQARQDESTPFDGQQYTIIHDKCKSFDCYYLH
jgi:hypothetical protein